MARPWPGPQLLKAAPTPGVTIGESRPSSGIWPASSCAPPTVIALTDSAGASSRRSEAVLARSERISDSTSAASVMSTSCGSTSATGWLPALTMNSTS
jgi:hypothetical protein